MTNIAEIIAELKKPFPAADHKERELPGGGRWFFLPWQKIRDRLDQVCPEWEATYSDPVTCEALVVVRCRITINGITREGVGNSEATKGYGTPVERATADAFKNAAEAFGVGAYLDNQSLVIRHLQSQGDGRGVQFAMRDKNGEKSQHYNRNKPPSRQPQRAIAANSTPNSDYSEICRTWKSEADAIAWAKTQVPHLDEPALKAMLNDTPADPKTNKKAIAWVQRIQRAVDF